MAQPLWVSQRKGLSLPSNIGLVNSQLWDNCLGGVSWVASTCAVYPHPYRHVKMALGILTKGPNLDWTEDKQIYDCFKAWGKRVEMLMTGMALKKEPNDSICHCIKAWLGDTSHAHIEATGLTGDDAASTKCLLDTLKGHCKQWSNKIVAATTYKQLVQWDLGLLEYIEICKEVTAACNFGTAYDKCLKIPYY